MSARIHAKVWLVLLVAALVVSIIPLRSFARPTNGLVALRGVKAPHPQLVAPAAASFRRARATIAARCGRDLLGKLDEALRPVGFMSTKSGVANRSWHKAGRAIDIKQSSPGVVVIRDLKQRGLKRVLLRCAKQNGSQGQWYGPKRIQGRGKPGFYLDVTTVMLNEGWTRIGAQQGVSEWWHYEYRKGVRNWQQAMLQIYSGRKLRQLYPKAFGR